MLNSPYVYQLELLTGEGKAIGRAALTVDWEPAREWTRFVAVRAGRIAANALDAVATAHPIWHTQAGEPYVEGFKVALTIDDQEVTRDFSTDYFAVLARTALEAFREREGLKPEDSVRYITTAYHAVASEVAPTASQPDAASGRRGGFVAREIATDLILSDMSLAPFARRAVVRGGPSSGEMPVFVPERVLQEAASLTRSVGEKETGGILIGHLYRDPRVADVFAEVTAQLPARHTEADLTTLAFTPATWTDVRSAMALRARREVMLGWWHSHPVREWCKACSPERQRVCSLAAGFLSTHDRALHRTVFPRAYSLALVVNDVAIDGPTFTMFGWRDGVLEKRGFAELGELDDEQR